MNIVEAFSITIDLARQSISNDDGVPHEGSEDARDAISAVETYALDQGVLDLPRDVIKSRDPKSDNTSCDVTHSVTDHYLFLKLTLDCDPQSGPSNDPRGWKWRELLDLRSHENLVIYGHDEGLHDYEVTDKGKPL